MTDTAPTVPTSSVDEALDRIRGRLTEAGLGRSTAELGSVVTHLSLTYRQTIIAALFPERMNTLGFRLGDLERLLDDTFADLIHGGEGERARRLSAIRAALTTLDAAALSLMTIGDKIETSASQDSTPAAP
ncbi:hypothetical protein [Streptomyces sp. NPDC088707]|uniref:hypothetical protein n=1 Tax=Streptomyces sp. NPDC088707 TaxID=3365871 RepID=UPI00382F3A04